MNLMRLGWAVLLAAVALDALTLADCVAPPGEFLAALNLMAAPVALVAFARLVYRAWREGHEKAWAGAALLQGRRSPAQPSLSCSRARGMLPLVPAGHESADWWRWN